MPENVLEKIIQKKSEKIVNLKKNVSLDLLSEMIDKNKSFDERLIILFFLFLFLCIIYTTKT